MLNGLYASDEYYVSSVSMLPASIHNLSNDNYVCYEIKNDRFREDRKLYFNLDQYNRDAKNEELKNISYYDVTNSVH